MTVTVEGTQGAGSALDRTRLLKDLQAQARLLEDDLRRRTDDEPEFRDALRVEYDKAVAAERTAAMYETWRDDRVVQIAAAWVLACVFVRFSEDNGLIADPWLSGPGERLAEAQDRHDAYFRANPSKNDRDWLLDSFDALAKSHRTVEGLFDRAHNPLYEVTPSYEAATALLAFWRQRGADGEIVHDFTDPELDTRFLGDLYQDLSEHARKTYALLQTPVFVEEFILDLTLEPAVEEFGLTPAWKHRPGGWHGEVSPDGPDGAEVVRGLRCIDPACGSGHFLLGLFERLLAKWREAEPGTEPWVLVRRALESVHGADKNPFAVAIARFRLVVAALKACGVRELGSAPELPIRVAVADSLLHGRDAGRSSDPTLDDAEDDDVFTYRTEDVKEYARSVDLLGRGSYHVVAGNPPYKQVKDSGENESYRRAYFSCSGRYQLSVPFAQRIYELAIRGNSSERGGFTAQITSNGFMRASFGKGLIESFFHGGEYKDIQTRRKRHFPGVRITHIIDTSGAYIPGHGTSTVIIAGINEIAKASDTIRIVSSTQGSHSTPEDPSLAPAWVKIVENSHTASDKLTSNPWVDAFDASRTSFAAHPWTLGGSQVEHTLEKIEQNGGNSTKARFDKVFGFAGFSGVDDAFYFSPDWHRRHGTPSRMQREVALNNDLRDWQLRSKLIAIAPYDESGEVLSIDTTQPWARHLWMTKRILDALADFSGKTRQEAGVLNFSWYRWTHSRAGAGVTLAFSKISSHNHAAINHKEAITTQHLPAISLTGIDNSTAPGIAAALNSSTAGFWIKQVCQPKGGDPVGNEGARVSAHPWSDRYEFTGTKLQEFPLPGQLPLALGRELDTLAQASAQHAPSVLAHNAVPTRAAMDDGLQEQERTRARMIALQEELDWTVYGAYGLLTADEVTRTTVPDIDTSLPEVALGQRAFEIVLARSGAETAWFERHGSTPVTEIPAHWPEAYRKVVQARIDLIEANKDIRLIERPEYKRRWSTEPWEKREAAALRNWLLDAAEREELWFEERDGFTVPRPLTVNQLADELRHDDDVQAVAALYAADHLGKRDASLATVLAAVIEAEHVPYLAALRYKDSGLRKRAQWEQVWEQQREEDRTGQRLDIKVPPKYTSADFTKNSYWSHRGKLDVPKERFISYPGASLESDPSLLLGWAGWNHRDQADALVGLVRSRIEEGGWEKKDPRLVPLLAGLREVLPWVHQWYGEYDEEWEGNPAEEFQAALDSGRADAELSENDLVAWRPEKKTRGRQKKSE
ncbi:BREX-2 system adenine-specific DNA-methyltransferase PglX [Streptomyces hirsutus]|uniref:BREX-2 system adenine-specific DNA-methyltransferase PglX n=1 Tax=Streptomyces hirsutus TaxID=35620 RepID=UPI0034055681